MNYRHIYHAGNFADVIKHVMLIMALQSLQRKETPYLYLETHAGIGLYSLQSAQAQKKQEYGNGVGKLVSINEKVPTEIEDYLSIIKNYNDASSLHFYPGSPLFAAAVSRKQDQLILCELHPEDIQTLKITMGTESNCAIHHIDAYAALKAFVPPKQKRGLVLIDPPFEVTDEFERIVHGIKIALKHWRSGIFMIWYPIKNEIAVKQFYREIDALQIPRLIVEFGIENHVDVGKLARCGVMVINPPWKMQESLEDSVLPFLEKTLEATGKIKS